ncbi:hypothetical protein SLEP1_g36244 [Rubroshorea leprosula]|uniref:peroxidase n=1 Tax=Rubroshorea leprosula TaxID=152421 RepID=A0AAV5KRD6_9ROSI|nr:hypothetical protein SLEP1_g36244 [Rubroshorea leprosula]
MRMPGAEVLKIVYTYAYVHRTSKLLPIKNGNLEGGLELPFYRRSCAVAEMIVKQEMKRCILTDLSTAAAILRLAFHNCQVDSCELAMAQFFWRNQITPKLNYISCVDIIQMAAREAIFLTGRQYIEIVTGRRDGISLCKKSADYQLPATNIPVNEFIEIFQQKSIGIGHSRSFEERLRPVTDPTLSPTFSLAM